jgi:hypothetical protein
MRFDILRRGWSELVGRKRATRRDGLLRRIRFEALEDRRLLTASPTRPDYQISVDTAAQVGPAVDVAQNGDFVVAWTATVTDLAVGNSTVTHSVPVFRRYAANGLPKDTEPQEVYNNLLNQFDVDVAVAPAGNFVVVWTDEDSAGDTDIFFQRYSADGTVQGSATQVNTTNVATTNQSDAAIGIADNGDFVVTWTHTPTSGNTEIYYRRYTSAGVAKDSTDVMIPNSGSNSRSESDVAVGSTGNTIITWAQQDLNNTNIYYEALRGTDGSNYIAITQANTTVGRDQTNPSVDIDLRGYFDIAWADAVSTTDHDILLRRFTNNGAVRNPTDVTVSSTTADETDPSVGAAVGQFVVAWQSNASSVQQTQYQLFTDTGAAIQAVAKLDPNTFLTTTSDVAMNYDAEFALVAEHTTNVEPLIQGLNYRNADATPGLYDPSTALFYLRNSNTTGMADTVFVFAGDTASLTPISGDWDGDGVGTVGLYDATTSRFYLTDSTTAAVAEIAFGFGFPDQGWIPVVGDWNADGADEVGVYDPLGSVFYLASDFSGGLYAIVAFGPANGGWLPVAGNWDGASGDTIGLYDRVGSTFYLRNENTSGVADLIIGFGPADGTQLPVTGDWNNNGTDTIGIYDPASSMFNLRNENSSGFADITIGFGPGFGGWLPLANQWQAGAADTIALYAPSGSTFYKRFSNTSGFADASQAFGVAMTNFQAVSGDWNFDGVTTVGLYDPTTTTFYLRNENTTGTATTTVVLSEVPQGGIALTGDWNGDGAVDLGVYNPLTSGFYLKYNNTPGPADLVFAFGEPGWLPVAGDWNNDGIDTIGVYDPEASVFYLTNTNATGVAEIAAAFGAPGWEPLAGDWNRDGTTTIGVYDPTTSTYYLRNSATSGIADITVAFGVGNAGWEPIVGDWPGVGAASLMAVAAPESHTGVAVLTDQQLALVASQGIAAWVQAGLPESLAAELRTLEFRVADLAGNQLGLAADNVVYVDQDAAGYGWYLDESSSVGTPTLDPTAVDQIDLASVVMHEMGHELGLGDTDGGASLMSGQLPAGVRHTPGTAEIDAVLAAF